MENIPESVVPFGPVSLARTQESHWGVSATSLPINTDVTVQIQTLISHTSFRIVIFFLWALFSPPQDIVMDYQQFQHLSNWQEAVQAQMEASQLPS